VGATESLMSGAAISSPPVQQPQTTRDNPERVQSDNNDTEIVPCKQIW